MQSSSSVGGNSSHSNEISQRVRTANIQNTPFTNRRICLHQWKKSAESRQALKILENLLKRPWNAFSVSPLFTWSGRESKLKRYSRRMCHFLAETLPVEDGDTFEVDYEIVENLKLNGSDDPAVKITVNRPHGDNLKQVFLGYLLSWGCPKAAKCKELDGVLYLPVFLCSGSKRVGTQVCRALENIHDCVVSSLELYESDRKELWMALLSYLENKGETVTIRYVIPNRPKIGSIGISIPANLTTKLSRLIIKKHNNDISYEEIDLFWNEINNNVQNIFQINVQYCEIVKLQLPQVTIAADKFRANKVEAMHVILQFLSNMSVKLESPTD